MELPKWGIFILGLFLGSGVGILFMGLISINRHNEMQAEIDRLQKIAILLGEK